MRLCAGVRSGTATRQRACVSCAPGPIAATHGSAPPCQEMTLPLYDNANLEEVAAHLTAASIREKEVDAEWAARAYFDMLNALRTEREQRERKARFK